MIVHKCEWKSESEVAQSCSILCDPTDCSLSGSSIHGISRQEYWSGVPFPSPGSLPDSGVEHGSLTLQADSLLSEPPRKPIQFQFSSVQSLSRVWLFATPWTRPCQASPSITNSQGPPKPMSIESVMPSNHFILCSPLLLLPSIFPSIQFSQHNLLKKLSFPYCISWLFAWKNNWSFKQEFISGLSVLSH